MIILDKILNFRQLNKVLQIKKYQCKHFSQYLTMVEVVQPKGQSKFLRKWTSMVSL